MALTLQGMLTSARIKLGDTQVRRYPEPFLVYAANEGKNELVKAIRQARESYFETSSTGTITPASSPTPSYIVLPSDFAELKQIMVTDVGYQDIEIIYKRESDPLFKRALIDGGAFGAGMGAFYYDLIANGTMVLAPGSDLTFNYKILYIQTVPDMALPDDTITGIQQEHQDFIVTWMVCEGFRFSSDPRLESFLAKLQAQRDSVLASVNERQIKEPKFASAFMESEQW